MIKSFFFLLGLYFLRHIPLAIFWGLYSLFPQEKKSKIGLGLSIIFLAIGYGAGFLLIMSIIIFILNVLIINNFQSTILPILLTQEIITAGKLNSIKSKYFSLLLSRLVYSKRFSLPLKFLLRLVEFLALISIGIGLVDVLNDIASHENPDLFDLLFPLGGAMMLYGGITLLSITSFFLYFVFPTRSIQKWEKRLSVSLNLPAGLRNYIVSPSLLHPYFFLTPKGRFLTTRKAPPTKTLTLLLEKALLDNKDQIPEEWLEK
jgi:hypothetical protein